ncbi:MAG TPA: TetR/AcrR family transcriptional regulator [Phaeodactylibacter sp.]|nr:TetR/AcrR family transcriptional regulator [Phaeodactylibacter sp.]
MPKVKQFDEKKILENAMNLFWKKGYHATSIQDLVSHLGINRSSIYDTYGGKKELFDQSFELYRTEGIAGLTVFLKKQTSVKKGFQNLFKSAIKQSLSDSDRKGCFVVNTTTELIPGDEAIQNILKKNKAAYEKIFYHFLLSGERSGEIPKGKDLKSIASLFYTFNNGLKVVAKIEPSRKKLLASVNVMLSLLD